MLVLRVIAPSTLFAFQSQPEAKLTFHEFDKREQKVSEIVIQIQQLSLKKIHLKMPSAT